MIETIQDFIKLGNGSIYQIAIEIELDAFCLTAFLMH
jgi:hypothetical protein